MRMMTIKSNTCIRTFARLLFCLISFISFSSLAEENLNQSQTTGSSNTGNSTGTAASTTGISSTTGANSNSTGNSNSNQSGKVSSQPKSLPYFNKIVAVGIGNLYIKQGKEQNLAVKTEVALLPLISATVEDETLRLDFKGANEYPRAEINYYLTIKDIKSIQSLSSSIIFIEEGIETDELILEIKSFGEMNVNINVKKLIAKIEGAGKIKAHGNAALQEIQINGTGEFIGIDLIGDDIDVTIDGTGIATVKAGHHLKISIPKEGTVRYCGEPSISKEVSATAIVEVVPKNLCK